MVYPCFTLFAQVMGEAVPDIPAIELPDLSFPVAAVCTGSRTAMRIAIRNKKRDETFTRSSVSENDSFL
jgi:hypothetical protein